MFKHITGPMLGAIAPFFETAKKEDGIIIDNFKGSWVVLFTHPDDLIPVFKTRTINYILCKRRIKALAIGHRESLEAISPGNFLKKYMVNHSLTVIDDGDNQIAMRYGLDCSDKGGSVKGVFVIDPKGYLRIKLFYSLKTERDFTEILKLVDALQIADKQSKHKNGLQAVKVLKQDGVT
jgi:peroxiredoxin (alkyl hydroperoxide reductase subunit C)